MPSIAIRPLRSDDAARVAELGRELGYPGTTESFAVRFDLVSGRPEQFVAAAWVGDVIGGWTHAQTQVTLESDPHVQIVGLVVSERHRRRGVGRALVDSVIAWTRQLGHTTIRVRSNAARVEAHHFYPALGFARTKTQHAYRLLVAGR